MILCQYDDNLSPVHSFYFIVLSTTMTCHMFHFISPSLRSGFMESYIISTSNSSHHSIPKNLRKQAVLDVGDLVLRKDSTPSAAAGATTPVDATALSSEVFQALQITASEAWGEGILGPKKGGFFFGWIWKGMKFDDKMYSTLLGISCFFLREMFGLVGWNKRGHENLPSFFLGGGVKKWNMYLYFVFYLQWFGLWGLNFVAIIGGSWWFESVADGIFVSGSAVLCQYDSPSKRMDLNEKGRVRSVRGGGLKSILATRNSTNCSVNPHRS